MLFAAILSTVTLAALALDLLLYRPAPAPSEHSITVDLSQRS
jgi:hypothetical protein